VVTCCSWLEPSMHTEDKADISFHKAGFVLPRSTLGYREGNGYQCPCSGKVGIYAVIAGWMTCTDWRWMNSSSDQIWDLFIISGALPWASIIGLMSCLCLKAYLGYRTSWTAHKSRGYDDSATWWQGIRYQHRFPVLNLHVTIFWDPRVARGVIWWVLQTAEERTSLVWERGLFIDEQTPSQTIGEWQRLVYRSNRWSFCPGK